MSREEGVFPLSASHTTSVLVGLFAAAALFGRPAAPPQAAVEPETSAIDTARGDRLSSEPDLSAVVPVVRLIAELAGVDPTPPDVIESWVAVEALARRTQDEALGQVVRG